MFHDREFCGTFAYSSRALRHIALVTVSGECEADDGGTDGVVCETGGAVTVSMMQDRDDCTRKGLKQWMVGKRPKLLAFFQTSRTN